MTRTALMLDALDPPAGLVTDMNAVGAAGIAAYVLRRNAGGAGLDIGTWEAGRIAAAQAAGKFVLPILVPGSSPRPTDMQTAIDSARALGIATKVMVVDIEQNSLPQPSWLRDSISAAHAAGYVVWRYGDLGVLGGYPAADGDWISHGYIPVRAGTYLPVPNLPAGPVADQYAVQVIVNGSEYDVSVVDVDALGANVTVHREDTQVAGKIIRAPYDPNRLDVVWVGEDGTYRVKTSTGGAGGLDGNDEAAPIDAAGTPSGGFFDCDAVWDNLNRLCYLGFGNDGRLYLAVERLDGGFDQGWSALPNARCAVPSRPVIQPAPDVQLRDALRLTLDGLK